MKHNGKEYPGIEEYWSVKRRPLIGSEYLIVVWFDGEPDMYICEGIQCLGMLEMMYRDEWQETYENHVDFIQVFKQATSKYTSAEAMEALNATN